MLGIELTQRLLTAHRGHRIMLALYGDAGQGKSTILGLLADRAEACGLRVLRLTGTASNADIPYSGVRSLFSDYLPVIGPDASPAQRMLRALVSDFLPPQSPLAVCGAINAWFDCITPVDCSVILVDDADQIDEDSLRVLTYVAAQRPAGRVSVVCASTWTVPVLDRVRATKIYLEDLARREAEALLDRHGVNTRFQTELVRRLGGNPLALSFAAQAGPRAADENPDDPVPLHPRLASDVQRRMSLLPRPTSYLLEAAAVNRNYDIATLSAWSTHGDLGPAETLIPAAEDAGLVTTDRDALRWRRPWIGEGVLHLCPLGRRQRLRHQMARGLARRPAVSAGWNGPPSPIDRLTPAEARVARAVSGGLTTREAASTLCLSEKTVDSHLQHIYRKFNVRSRAQLVAAMWSAAAP